LWLPLVHEHCDDRQNDNFLIPPVDIAWLWHCHRLSPCRYSSYCKKRFGGNIVEARPPFTATAAAPVVSTSEDDASSLFLDGGNPKVNDVTVLKTIELWNTKYPTETFYLGSSNEATHESLPSPLQILDGFDLLGSAERQSTFLWQVSTPYYEESSFLSNGLMNYWKFLHLRKECCDGGDPDMIIVPTFQIDLFWHTHILSSITQYNADCKIIIGSILNHDDDFDDRSEGGPLDTAFVATKNAWKRLYGEEYLVVGGMYRGEPPKQYYSPYFVLESKRHIFYHCTVDPPTDHPYNKFIGLQGASSTVKSSPSPRNGDGAYDREIIWCWKETASQMENHPSSAIVGDPADCWVRYSSHDNELLEVSFQALTGNGQVAINNDEYKVDLTTMIQTKMSTGFVREVQRFTKTTSVDGSTSLIATGIPSTIPPSSATTSSSNSIMPTAVAVPVASFSPSLPAQWTSPFDSTLPAFIPASKESAAVGGDANPRKMDYIFGEGSRGLGYYHVTTKDAYFILDKRIRTRIRMMESDIAMAQCCSTTKSPQVLRMEKDLEELKGHREVVSARAKAQVPVGKLNVPSTLSSPIKKKNDSLANNIYYTDDGTWLFPADLCAAGGGCGATGHIAGGCGGGGASGAGGGCK
jgi:hypothetical protein